MGKLEWQLEWRRDWLQSGSSNDQRSDWGNY